MKTSLFGPVLLCTLGNVAAACAPQETVPPPAAPRLLLAEAVPAASNDPPPSRIERLRKQDDRDFARMGGWVAVAAGSLAGTIALFTSYQMLHDKSIRDSDCNASKVCSSDGLNANTDLSSLAGWNVGAWALTAVGFGLGTFLVLTNPSESDKSTQVGIAPTGSGGGLVVRGGF